MRDAVIIFIAIILSMLIGSYLFFNGGPPFHGASVVTESQGDQGTFSVLAEGQGSGAIDRRTNYRITDDEELRDLWEMLYGAGTAVPYVNFDRDEVIAVFDGTHSSGGYRISVTDVDDGDVRTVHIRHETPGEKCITTEAITSPFQVVRVKKTTLSLAKAEETVTRDCR